MAGFGSAHYDQHGCNRNVTIGGCEGRNRTSIFGLRSLGSLSRGGLWGFGAQKVIGSEGWGLAYMCQIIAREALALSLVNFQVLPKHCHKIFKRIPHLLSREKKMRVSKLRGNHSRQ